MHKPFLSLMSLCFFLAACTSRPADIPRDATRHWGHLTSYTWTWTRDLSNGCVAWMAKEDWASVQINVEAPCEGDPQIGLPKGKGSSYTSFEDFLVFHDYWPWSSDIYGDLFVYDDGGMIEDMLPCPYTISEAQIRDLQRVSAEALSRAETDGERRILTRVGQRLANLDGNALEATQGGCSDRPDNNRKIKKDLWDITQQP